MAAPINPTIKLKDCVFSYSEAAKQSESEFKRLWRMAFRGFKRMGINGFWEPKTEVLTVNANNTADLPPSCIQWIKVGQFNENGELQTLRINRQLTNFHANLPTRLDDIVPQIQSCSETLLNGGWYNGYGVYGDWGPSSVNQNFGAGSSLVQFGEFNIDWDARVILLDPNYAYTQVVLFFLSAPEMDDDYEIPMQYEEAMIDWLSWQDIKHIPANSHANNNSIRARAIAFKASLTQAKREYKPFRLAEAEQYSVESQMLAIKP